MHNFWLLNSNYSYGSPIDPGFLVRIPIEIEDDMSKGARCDASNVVNYLANGEFNSAKSLHFKVCQLKYYHFNILKNVSDNQNYFL